MTIKRSHETAKSNIEKNEQNFVVFPVGAHSRALLQRFSKGR